MPSRQLDFPVFDCDNHMYETPDALTKFIDPAFEGVIDYVDVDGRTKIRVKGQISEYIPNPTFAKVAAPGAQEDYFRQREPREQDPPGDHGQGHRGPARLPRARRRASS